jgi:hypothetical protein
VLAGVDPAAIDAVGCRVMGYDYRQVPSIANADSDLVHPIGTNDPDDIVVIGDEIGVEFDHVFEFNDAWAGDAGLLSITDFTPPVINSYDKQGDTITADISDGTTAHVLYQVAGVDYIEKMSRSGDTYSVTVTGDVTSYQVLAQDEYFNSKQSAVVNATDIISLTVTDHNGDGISFGTLDPGMKNRPADGQPVEATVNLTVESETNVNVDIRIKGTDLTGPGTIEISNVKYHDSNQFNSALNMSDVFTYWYSVTVPIAEDHVTPVYHWISVPEGQPPGTYTGAFSYQAVKTP